MSTEKTKDNPIFDDADKLIKKLLFRGSLIILLLGSILYVDRPVYTGTTLNGLVVSVAGETTGYKSLSTTVKANIKLENGDVTYKIIQGAHIGKSVTIRVYKRRISGIVHYK